LLARFTGKKEIYDLIDKILTDAGNLLHESLKKFDSKDSGIIKWKILNDLDNYLKAHVQCKKRPLPALINQYAGLYKQGKIAGCFSTGYYLEKLVSDTKINNTIRTIKESAVQNIYTDSFSLARRIDLLYLMNQENHCRQEQINMLEQDLFDMDNPNYEKKIICSVMNQGLIAGYGFGVARLLLYWIYKENKRNGLDCSRFK
jgi:hypothetical protein